MAGHWVGGQSGKWEGAVGVGEVMRTYAYADESMKSVSQAMYTSGHPSCHVHVESEEDFDS